MSQKKAIRQAVLNSLGPRGFMAAMRLFYFGTSRRCLVCGARTRRFLDQGYRYPILNALQIVGGMPTRNEECPVCRSAARVRLVYFYLERFTDFFTTAHPILHMAPERGLMMHLAKVNGDSYVCGDLSPAQYVALRPIRQLDVTRLPFDDATFDLVICNHVLEHVPEDRTAMRELRRVLKPGGLAILQVPLSMKLGATREGIPADTDEERIRHYGQRDHVRIYTLKDYVSRLRESGFNVDLFEAYEADAEAAFAMDIDPLEKLMLCRNPA
jgi:SAM-dependent methyltransferase